MRPNSIVTFERLYLGSLALGILNFFLSFDQMKAAMAAEPGIAKVGFGSGMLIGVFVVSLLISLLLWFFIARKASNVAKWILVVFTAFGLLGLPNVISQLSTTPGLTPVLALVITIIQLIAVYFLFRPDAAAWLKGAAPTDPTTFD